MKINSIKMKFWIGVIAILIGYTSSISMFYFSSNMVLNKMKSVSEANFPASKLGQKLLGNFRNHVKLFNDSVLVGDINKIQEAQEIGKTCSSDLKKLIELTDDTSPDYSRLNLLADELTAYSDEATKVYTRMAGGENDDLLMQQARQLAEKKNIIEQKLDALEQATSKDLLSTLNAVGIYLEEKTRLSFIVFLLILISCILIVHYIIKTYLVKPLDEITSAAAEMEQGNFDITIAYHSKDEMGILADAFRQMAGSQLKKAQLASVIADGDLTCKVNLDSDKDQLGKALLEMVSSLHSIIRKFPGKRNRCLKPAGHSQMVQFRLLLLWKKFQHP